MLKRILPKFSFLIVVCLVGIAATPSPAGETCEDEITCNLTMIPGDPPFGWQLEIYGEEPEAGPKTAVDDRQAFRSRLVELLEAEFGGRNIFYEVAESNRGDGRGWRLVLMGKAGGTELRRVLFADLAPEIDFLGGPVEIVLAGQAQGGQTMTIVLSGRPSTGYEWEVVGGSEVGLTLAGHSEWQKGDGPNSPATANFSLRAESAGEVAVRLIYRRPWEVAAPTRRLYLQMPAWLTAIDLSDQVALMAPSRAAMAESANVAPIQAEKPLPSTWDWRAAGKVTAIRDQGACGSCWAFAVVGVLESVILINGDASSALDLAEQFLVSCNTYNYSCAGGYFSAHAFHTDVLAKYQTVAGAVLESDMPYVAANGVCRSVPHHPYRLSAWNYVPSTSLLPSVETLKSYIYNYGPVTAGVCVGNAFQRYAGGVFATDEKMVCNGGLGVNHGVVLVGWDDSEQTWLLRNSWGPAWGEAGYMRIRWGTSNIGLDATYVVYGGSVAADALAGCDRLKGGCVYLPMVSRP